MNLTWLEVEYCVLVPLSETSVQQKHKNIKYLRYSKGETCCDTLKLDVCKVMSYFPSLHYCELDIGSFIDIPKLLNSCKELIYGSFISSHHSHEAKPFYVAQPHSHNLQQMRIDSPYTDVPDDFMASISAHGELVHVVMRVRSLTVKGIMSLVRNSLKLVSLNIRPYNEQGGIDAMELQHCITTLKKKLYDRKLFTDGQCTLQNIASLTSSFPYDLFPMMRQDPLLSKLYAKHEV